MPIYEYQCTACHHQFDALQKLNEPAIELCPQCGKMKAKRLVSAAGFQLKGSGWYATDFKNKTKPPKAAQSDTVAKTDKTETKPADSASVGTAKQKGESD